jgi:hypothetical protein
MLTNRKRRKTGRMLEVEARLGRPVEEVLRERHRALGNYAKVAEELDLPPSTVYNWMLRFGIPLSEFVVPDDLPLEVPA